MNGTAPEGPAIEKAYNDGDGLFVARHILVMADSKTLKPDQIEAKRKEADGIRKQLTPANFVAMVKKYSGDPGSKQETANERLVFVF